MHKVQACSIVWFRNDLRIDDHAALQAAIAYGRPIIPIYVLDQESPGCWAIGSASSWWLHHALLSLSQRLSRYGATLYYFKGSVEKVISEICDDIEVEAVFFNTSNEAWALRQQASLTELCTQRHLHLNISRSNELLNPDLLLNQQGQPYRVFTPFWKAAREKGIVRPNRTAIDKALWINDCLNTEVNLESLALMPKIPWDSEFYQHWKVDEEGLKSSLKNLKEIIESYSVDRDFPAIKATSRLSPYLAFGQVSPARVISIIGQHDCADKFLSELGWREFSRYLQYHFPDTPDQPMNVKFRQVPWINDPQDLLRWQTGQTGIPIVDAGMRELWRTGWMHNRVRMIVASFLVKHLLIDWKKGAEWFWDTLLDADLANNTQGWQWVAGCGADAPPYFRVFNPVTQSKKFDKEGEYLRRWIPELSLLPNKFIHEPWTAPDSLLSELDITLGQSYPKPVIDLKFGRERALEVFNGLPA